MKAPPSELSHLLQLLAYPFPSETRAKAGSRLTVADWQAMKDVLRVIGRERDPLSGDHRPWVERVATVERPSAWFHERLALAGKLAFETTKLSDAGAWVTTIDDPAYPRKLRERLGSKAPLLLLGAGPATLANRKAAAFVGSREIDAAALDFTRTAVRKAVHEDYVVCSGGAKGVDRAAEEAGLATGGHVVLYPTEGILQALRERRFREPIADGRMLLLSPHPPNAGWSVGLAMARNKLIHAHADFVLVAASSDREGGTWAGATENFREGWTPVAVRNDADAPQGNRGLIALGGIPLTTEDVRGRESFRRLLLGRMPKPASKTITLEDILRAARPSFVAASRASSSFEEFAHRAGLDVRQARKWGLENEFTPATSSTSKKPRKPSHDCFELIWPSLQEAIESQGEQNARDALKLDGHQLARWKKRSDESEPGKRRPPMNASLDEFGG